MSLKQLAQLVRSSAVTVMSVVALFAWAPLVASAADAALADAVQRMDRTAVESLLQRSVDVNLPQVDGITALHWAAYHDEVKLAETLLQAGADATALSRYGVTPLSLACTNGNVVMVELFLDAGADPNTTLPGGETVVMTAARTGQVGAVRALLARGADAHAKEDRRGQTALMWAAAEGHTAVVEGPARDWCRLPNAARVRVYAAAVRRAGRPNRRRASLTRGWRGRQHDGAIHGRERVRPRRTHVAEGREPRAGGGDECALRAGGYAAGC